MEKIKNFIDILISKNDAVNFIELNTFNDEITVSEVVKFFDKHGREFTKTMIQNYVKIGLLPPAKDKRYYTKDHLVLLVLIDSLKSNFTLDEIKKVFEPILKDSDTFDDDIIRVSDIYDAYGKISKEINSRFVNDLPNLVSYMGNVLEKDEYDFSTDKDLEDETNEFIFQLILMAYSVNIKNILLEFHKKIK